MLTTPLDAHMPAALDDDAISARQHRRGPATRAASQVSRYRRHYFHAAFHDYYDSQISGPQAGAMRVFGLHASFATFGWLASYYFYIMMISFLAIRIFYARFGI